MKAILGAAVLMVAVAGGFLCGAINAITHETWPDW